jgi:succinyl-CoA synthetase beta subunit
MKLHEYQSKDLLAQFGVAVPGGKVANNADDARKIAEELGGKCVVKAQVLMGGRGKAGGVKLFDNANDAAAFTQELIGKRLVSYQNPAGMIVEQVLVGELVDIAEEYYVAVLLDRAEQKTVVMISAEGGVDIEETAANKPEAIVRLHVDPAWGLSDFQVRDAIAAAHIPGPARRGLAALIKGLVKAYEASDAEMIEINPVALTPDGRVLAADAKVSIDDNALFRHAGFQATEKDSYDDPLEAEAAEKNIAYVRLGGDIGIIGNGAGLVMCSLDEVKAAGGSPANFLDVGGGAQAEKVKACVEHVLKDPNVKGLMINIFGGITHGAQVAQGILTAFEQLDVNIPVVARIDGTGAEEGLKLLEGSQIVGAQTMQEAAAKVVALAAK